jgi:hypothetical protein
MALDEAVVAVRFDGDVGAETSANVVAVASALCALVFSFASKASMLYVYKVDGDNPGS